MQLIAKVTLRFDTEDYTDDVLTLPEQKDLVQDMLNGIQKMPDDRSIEIVGGDPESK